MDVYTGDGHDIIKQHLNPSCGPGSLNPIPNPISARRIQNRAGMCLNASGVFVALNLHVEMGKKHCAIDKIQTGSFSTFVMNSFETQTRKRTQTKI